ncbi:uncharacterized protein LOC117242159 isoform X1 [Bombus vosnesenskii]|uniref:Uncharacterized protein LOC117242159 isoform X1 n=1 Tax=Bombus vosnesenskii TaxID=207650 RepID=A0A6J3LFZ8_9HYME|nr:uncharacterized protein LOC117242159 isoform X1 [Bombus vosnesenskii]
MTQLGKKGITIIVRAEAVITGNNGVSIALSWYAIVRNTRIELQFYCIAYCIAMYQVTNSNYLVLHSGHPPFILSAGLRPECMKCIALFLVMIQENLRVPFMRTSLYLQSIHLTIKQRGRLTENFAGRRNDKEYELSEKDYRAQ